MTEEPDITSEEDDEEIFSFQHKLIHEFVAALYISNAITTDSDFLNTNFVRCRDIEKHIEVICFCINISRVNTKSAQSLVKYITGKFADRLCNQIDKGEVLNMNELYEIQSTLSPMLQAYTGGPEVKQWKFIQASSVYVNTYLDLGNPSYSLYVSHTDINKGERNFLMIQNSSRRKLAICDSYQGNYSTDPEGQCRSEYFKGLERLTNLQKICLNKCEIPDTALKSLITKLSVITLKSCDLSGSRLGTNVQHLTEAMKVGLLGSMDTCNLNDCAIPASALVNFISELHQWPNLREVNLNGNAFREIQLNIQLNIGSDSHSVINSNDCEIQRALFKNIAGCEHIVLYSHDTDADDLAVVVKHCKSVILSNIERNKTDNDYDFEQSIQSVFLHDSCVKHITNAVSLHNTLLLEKIDLSGTKCSSDKLTSLFCVLHRCKHLKALVLTGPDFGRYIPISLPQSLHLVHVICGLEVLDVSGKDISNSLYLLTKHAQTSLVKLNVRMCNLTKADIEALATGIAAGMLPRLQELYLSGNDLSDSLHLLTEHAHKSLVKLDVNRCNLKRADIAVLAAAIEAGRFPELLEVYISPSKLRGSLPQSFHLVHLIPALEHLDVSGTDISNSLHLLTEHVHTRLVKLDVSQCNLTRSDIKALAAATQAGRCPKLQQIHLSCNDLSNSLHLLTEHEQTSLVKLDVSWCNLTRADIEALAAGIQGGRFPKLQKVYVKGNDLSQSLHLVHLLPGFTEELNVYSIMQSLPQSLCLVHLLPGLEELNVSRKNMGNSLHLLTEHEHTSLVKLNVSRCNLTRADIEALGAAIEAGRFPKLQKVNVSGNDLSQSLHLVHLLPGLVELNVSRKNIGNSLHLLTEHEQTSLVKLDVIRCKLTRADIEAMVAGIEAGRFPRLEEVDVWGNELSQSLDLVHLLPGFTEKLDVDSIKQFLPQSLCLVHLLPGLEELDVSGKDISNSLHLLTDNVQTSLVKLNGSKCNLRRADIEALAAALQAGTFPKLQQIHLSCNGLSNSLHLLTEHEQTSLVKLDVSCCKLVAADISALAAAVTTGRLLCLQEVALDGNALDDDSARTLCEALLQYEGPDQSVQSIMGYGRPKLSVELRGNNLSAGFVKQWAEKLKYKHNVKVWW